MLLLYMHMHMCMHMSMCMHMYMYMCVELTGGPSVMWFVIILSEILSRYKRSYTANPARVEAINA